MEDKVCDFCFKVIKEENAISKNIAHKRCCFCCKDCYKFYVMVETNSDWRAAK